MRPASRPALALAAAATLTVASLALAGCGRTAVDPAAHLSLSVPGPAIEIALVTPPPGRTPPPPAPSPDPRPADEVVLAQPTVAPTLPPIVEPGPTPDVEPSANGEMTNPEMGMQLFKQNACIACHGLDLQGGIGPSLAGRTAADLTNERILTQVHDGGEGMPAFPDLTEEDVQFITALIRSM